MIIGVGINPAYPPKNLKESFRTYTIRLLQSRSPIARAAENRIGGNSLGGGKFNLAGSIIGAYTIQAITTTLYALGVSSDVAPVYKAVIVIIIVTIQAPPFKAYMKRLSARRALEKPLQYRRFRPPGRRPHSIQR